ncbi:MAG: 23S rRNA pseudouridylate synthase B [Flavobacteriaceae bacterium]|jgi:23S rRNA pseudouridine2605 synthase|nr:23S rRNA pseudouridylate synthase B [Flavobacteriaceae bacterium]|tara:strand:+ start:862 stop:1572 length:711 start_codon:yes stop_codon:yes gene_type:complete
MSVRLQKAIADSGFVSRRKAEVLIKLGRVFINDNQASIGDKVIDSDRIYIDGKELKSEKIPDQMIMYHKPIGEICSRSGYGKPTVFDNLPKLKIGRWVALGRLDINTSGLLLFTNNGSLANKIIHPKNQIEREYLARIRGKPNSEDLKKLIKGLMVEGDILKFSDVVQGRQTSSHTWFAMVIMEGKNRAVRKLWNALDFEVSRLKRTRLGHIFLPSTLSPGKYKKLNEKEIKDFFK